MTAFTQPSTDSTLQAAPGPEASNAGSPTGIHGIRLSAIERLAVARRAPQIMRLHLGRAAVRTGVLMAGDAGAILVLRFLVHGVRDVGWLGGIASADVSRLIPQGALPLSQLLPAVLLGLIVLDTYGSSDLRRDARRLVAAATLGLALPYWSYVWSGLSPLALPGFILVASLVGAVLTVERYLVHKAVRWIWPAGPGAAKALLIGRPVEVQQALKHPALSDAREFTIAGLWDPDRLTLASGQSGFGQLWEQLKQSHADTLVLCGSLDDESFATIIDAAGAAGCQLYSLTRSTTLGGLESRMIWRRGAPLISLVRPGLRVRQLIIKRVLNLVMSGLGPLLVGLILLLAELAVRLSSPAPVLFRWIRVRLGRTDQVPEVRQPGFRAEAQGKELASQRLHQNASLQGD